MPSPSLRDRQSSGARGTGVAREPDSGNIYMGDPRFGTLDRVEAFMYAENNYHDLNLSATGSKHVTVVGNMTAGNKVDIQRDYEQADGTVIHSKLSVEFDDRLSKGMIELPGIPTSEPGRLLAVT